MSCVKIETTGATPSPRGFHTATIVGHSLIVFGGTDTASVFGIDPLHPPFLPSLISPFFLPPPKPKGDTYILDLDTKIWSEAKSNFRRGGLNPMPRHCHAAVR